MSEDESDFLSIIHVIWAADEQKESWLKEIAYGAKKTNQRCFKTYIMALFHGIY